MSFNKEFVYLQKTEGDYNYTRLPKGVVAKGLGILSPRNRNNYLAYKNNTQRNLLRKMQTLNRTKRNRNLANLREAALVSRSRPSSPTPRRTRRSRKV